MVDYPNEMKILYTLRQLKSFRLAIPDRHIYLFPHVHPLDYMDNFS